jgi:hypothetical protein
MTNPIYKRNIKDSLNASYHLALVGQVLPLVPPGRPIPGVREDYWSPYSGQDASAGFPLLIDLQGLVDVGLLAATELPAQCYQINVDW